MHPVSRAGTLGGAAVIAVALTMLPGSRSTTPAGSRSRKSMRPRARSWAVSVFVVAGLLGITMTQQPTAANAAVDGQGVGVEAHQGGAALGPANSLQLYATAIDLGVEVIELDVQFTSDHVAVINHEDRISDETASRAARDGVLVRNCDHDGWLIHTHTAAQVARIRCAGQPLPTLAQVIELVKPSRTRINLEIKTFDDVRGGTSLVQSAASRRDYARRAVQQMLDGGMKGRFFVSSFAWRDVADTVRAIDPGVPMMAIERSAHMNQAHTHAFPYRAIRDAKSKGVDGFALDARYAQVNFLDFIKASGMYPMLWNLPTEARARFAIASGVPLLSANDPIQARSLLDSLADWEPVATVTSGSLSGTTVVNETVSAGEVEYPRVINGYHLVPTSAQSRLSGARLQVTITGKGTGTVELIPRNSRSGIDGVRIPIPNGTSTTTVVVAPGDHGALRVTSSVSSKVKLKVIGWENVNY